MQNVLFIFKDNPWYINHIKFKFSKYYNLKFFFISSEISNSRNEIIKIINKLINKNKIDKVFFDIDYTSFIEVNFVSKIKAKTKIAFSFDTEENIDKVQRVLLSFTHFLSAEPIFVEKFKKRVNSLFFPLETNELYYKKIKSKKKYDILFFGESKGDRINYLKEITKLKIKKKFLIDQHKKVSDVKLNSLINQSKMIINFSKGIKKKSSFEYDQFKGRILMSGLGGTFCLSENYKSSKLIFKKKFPSFENKRDMINKINSLLHDKKKLNEITTNFVNSCQKYSDKNYVKVIRNFLEKKSKPKKINLEIFEILNIIKISSKKNNFHIYIKNLKEILFELMRFQNITDILNFFLVIFIGLIYLIVNLKKNLKF